VRERQTRGRKTINILTVTGPDHENGRDAASPGPATPVNRVSPLLFANPQNHDNNAAVDANAIAAALFFDWCLGRRR
jgi:hypothetical protein